MSQAGRELHLLVRHRDGRRVLVARGVQPRLPTAAFDVADGRTTVSGAVAVLRQRFGITAPILEIHFAYEMPLDDPAPVPVLTVTEPIDPDAAPAGLAWHELSEPIAVASPWLTARLAEWLAEWRAGAPPPDLRPRWARDGWYERASRWLTGSLEAIGRRSSGPIEQVRHWGISALLRAPTNRGAVWMKAVFPPFHHEPAVTELLASAFPDDLPRIFATDHAEGWLALDDLGSATVDDDPISAGWLEAPRTLARIQQAMAARMDDLLGLGCPRRPLAGLTDAVRAIVDEEPPLTGMTLDRETAERTVGRVARAVDALQPLALPDTLVHGDFHAGNVAVVGDRFVIFDWSDAAVGDPLVDVVTWLDRIDAADRKDAAWDAFVDAWADVVRPEDLQPLLADVLVAGAAYQTVSYAGIVRNIEPLRRLENADGLEEYLGAILATD